MDKYFLGHKPCQHDSQCEGYSAWAEAADDFTYIVDDADKLCDMCDDSLCPCDSISGRFCDRCTVWFTNFPLEIRFTQPEFSWVRMHWPVSFAHMA